MKPELAVRRLVHKLGYRYRLHSGALPGKPDLVFASRRKVIFVHGCFWHSHGCKLSHAPKSNRDYWDVKLERNKTRDLEHLRSIEDAGWTSLIIWECECTQEAELKKRLKHYLGRIHHK
jgi:DNA mismatch endonuclease (patch repair protein)